MLAHLKILICHLRRISISKVVLRSCFLRSLYNKQCCSLVIYDDHQHEQSLPWWPQRTRDPGPLLTPHWRPDQSCQTIDQTSPNILRTLTMSPKMEEFVGFNPRSWRKIVDHWQVSSIRAKQSSPGQPLAQLSCLWAVLQEEAIWQNFAEGWKVAILSINFKSWPPPWAARVWANLTGSTSHFDCSQSSTVRLFTSCESRFVIVLVLRERESHL